MHKGKYRGDGSRIAPWYRKLCEDLSFDYGTKWPDISSRNNPVLCEFCGTQLGTHWASAMVYKGYNYDTCCKHLAARPEQAQLFWYTNRLRIECAIATYMNVPRNIIEHCMALELQLYMHYNKDITHVKHTIGNTDGNGFENISSLD